MEKQPEQSNELGSCIDSLKGKTADEIVEIFLLFSESFLCLIPEQQYRLSDKLKNQIGEDVYREVLYSLIKKTGNVFGSHHGTLQVKAIQYGLSWSSTFLLQGDDDGSVWKIVKTYLTEDFLEHDPVSGATDINFLLSCLFKNMYEKSTEENQQKLCSLMIDSSSGVCLRKFGFQQLLENELRSSSSYEQVSGQDRAEKIISYGEELLPLYVKNKNIVNLNWILLSFYQRFPAHKDKALQSANKILSFAYLWNESNLPVEKNISIREKKQQRWMRNELHVSILGALQYLYESKEQIASRHERQDKILKDIALHEKLPGQDTLQKIGAHAYLDKLEVLLSTNNYAGVQALCEKLFGLVDEASARFSDVFPAAVYMVACRLLQKCQAVSVEERKIISFMLQRLVHKNNFPLLMKLLSTYANRGITKIERIVILEQDLVLFSKQLNNKCLSGEFGNMTEEIREERINTKKRLL